MTRDEFLKRLTKGLKGLPQETIDEMSADYAEHFEAALADGRSEAEVSEALGDPARLARELRLEAGIKRWQETRSPSTAWAAVVAFLGLGAIDILILLPILLPAVGVMFGFFVAVIAIFVGGGAMLIVGPFQDFPGGPFAAVLGGLGLMAGSVAFGALLAIVAIWLVNALMWFGRLHYRVLEPAINNQR
jgi:uncharacterized membrane protein